MPPRVPITRFPPPSVCAATIVGIVAIGQSKLWRRYGALVRRRSVRVAAIERRRALVERVATAVSALQEDAGVPAARSLRIALQATLGEVAASGEAGSDLQISRLDTELVRFARAMQGVAATKDVPAGELEHCLNAARSIAARYEQAARSGDAALAASERLFAGLALAGHVLAAALAALAVRANGSDAAARNDRDRAQDDGDDAGRQTEQGIEQAPVVIWTADRELRFTSLRGGGLRAFHCQPQALVGASLVEHIERSGDTGRILPIFDRALTGVPGDYHRSLAGRHFHTHVEPARDRDDRVTGVIGVALDVTDEYRLAQELRENQVALEHAESTVGVASWRIDVRTKIVTGSRQLHDILGIERDAELTAQQLRAFCHPDDRSVLDAARARTRMTGESAQFDVRIVRPDGSIRWVEEHLQFMRDERGEPQVLVGTMLDITDRKLAQEQLTFAAMHEMLTGLPNRRGLLAILGGILEAARPDGSLVAVLFIDVDGYDVINDTLGFPAGDELMMRAAERLRDWSTEGSTVAHFSRNQFVVVVPSLVNAAQPGAIARCLIAAFAQPFSVERNEIYCSLSIGIDCSTGAPATAESMIRNADTAMLYAKARGRNVARVFTPTMRADAADSMSREAELRRWFDNGDLSVHYQAIVTPAGRVVGFEALLRGRESGGGIVLPERFIPDAEASGLIVQIGAWALRQACLEMHAIKQRFPDARLAVNISARQLHEPDFELMIRRTLAETALEPRSLELEITESVLMADVSAVFPVLSRLRATGVRISLDDFGTGYSSLSYLKGLPVDTLKIDRSFVRDIADDQLDGAIAQAILALARSFGLRVIAEGVETETQRAYLEYIGCHELQGFLFGRPRAASELLAIPAKLPRERRPLAAVPRRYDYGEDRGEAKRASCT